MWRVTCGVPGDGVPSWGVPVGEADLGARTEGETVNRSRCHPIVSIGEIHHLRRSALDRDCVRRCACLMTTMRQRRNQEIR